MPRIALLQSETFASKDEAFAHHEQLIRQAAADGANIIVTQELFLTPYSAPSRTTPGSTSPIPCPAPSPNASATSPTKLGVELVASLFENRDPGLYHNTSVILDADGSLIGLYRKMHIPHDPASTKNTTSPPAIAAASLGHPLRRARHARLLGPVVSRGRAAHRPRGRRSSSTPPPSAGTRGSPTLGDAQHYAWETMQRGHAIANGVFVAPPSTAVGADDGTSPSGAAPSSPTPAASSPSATDKKEILLADLRPQASRTRRSWPFLRDRRIDAYGDLTKRWRE